MLSTFLSTLMVNKAVFEGRQEYTRHVHELNPESGCVTSCADMRANRPLGRTIADGNWHVDPDNLKPSTRPLPPFVSS